VVSSSGASGSFPGNRRTLPAVVETLTCVCGEPLAESVNDRGVVLPGGEQVPFRRNTDYVICSVCLRMYRATDLVEGRVEPVGEDEGSEQATEP
jgi:hypothetical protein